MYFEFSFIYRTYYHFEWWGSATPVLILSVSEFTLWFAIFTNYIFSKVCGERDSVFRLKTFQIDIKFSFCQLVYFQPSQSLLNGKRFFLRHETGNSSMYINCFWDSKHLDEKCPQITRWFVILSYLSSLCRLWQCWAKWMIFLPWKGAPSRRWERLDCVRADAEK